jgi:hypothetical protein
MNPKLETLVYDLLMGTESGAFRWGRTPETGVYRLMLDKGLVRIYRLGPMTAGQTFVGCTVLNSGGDVLHDVQVPRGEGGRLVELYDRVDGELQEGMDELLAEVRSRMQESGRRVPAGQK